MARSLRVEYEGAVYHVTARGNERRPIFEDDGDRERFLEKLSDTVEVYGLRLYAYVLMSNHYHLLVCTPRGNLCQAMQQFQGSYATWFNHRHGRTGHLYGGRYKAPLVDGDEYLLSLTRYVHLNPVKTKAMRGVGLKERIRALRGYRWSSYRSYVGYAAREKWVNYGPLMELAGRGKLREYQRFVEAGVAEDDEGLQKAMSVSSKAIGTQGFCEWVEAKYRELSEKQSSRADVAMRRTEAAVAPETVVRHVCDQFAMTAEVLFKGRGNHPARDVLMKGLHEFSGLTKREVGKVLGHTDGATVGKRLKALRTDAKRSRGIRKSWSQLCKSLPIANCKA